MLTLFEIKFNVPDTLWSISQALSTGLVGAANHCFAASDLRDQTSGNRGNQRLSSNAFHSLLCFVSTVLVIFWSAAPKLGFLASAQLGNLIKLQGNPSSINSGYFRRLRLSSSGFGYHINTV